MSHESASQIRIMNQWLRSEFQIWVINHESVSRVSIQSHKSFTWEAVNLFTFPNLNLNSLSKYCICSRPQRLQLDMVLNSLQEQSHVASLLGYSSPGELGANVPQPASPQRPAAPATSSTEAQDHLHLAEVLLKTLLLSIGFYTVSEQLMHVGQGGLHGVKCIVRVDCCLCVGACLRWAGEKQWQAAVQSSSETDRSAISLPPPPVSTA